MHQIIDQIAQELSVAPRQVAAAVNLLDGGATVPFIARYRKEATGSLDDSQLRTLETRLIYLRELAQRRDAILASVRAQDKLTPALEGALRAATTKQGLEDLYLPFKPKRRTRAQAACEAGLDALADALWADPTLVPQQAAQPYVRSAATEAGDDYTSVAAVLDGARDILAERWAEQATLIQALRDWLWEQAWLVSRRAAGTADQSEAAKFRDYFDYAEPLARVPSHRALAVFRGRAHQVLDVGLALAQDVDSARKSASAQVEYAQVATNNVANRVDTAAQTALAQEAQSRLAMHLGWRHSGRAADDWLARCVGWTWRVKLALSLERDVLARLREGAEAVAIDVFARNLRDLLLAAPAGAQAVLGLDPGIRTGVKVAVVDATGKLVESATVYPHEPRRDWVGSLHTLEALCRRHGVTLVAIGNGTASRETDQLAAELLVRLNTQAQPPVRKVVVSEAGASVYSASAYASQELPDVDVSLRGAASIARRLQDPLAELVKIEPKSIGVGQYQHDVNPTALARSLDAVVEDCVNQVGVDVNTASVPLLSRVSGLGGSVARALVRWRDAHGAFRHRRQLLEVTGLGPKTFEQCAGFLRIRGGDDPLDASAVHPESYPVVQRILARLGQPLTQVMGQPDALRGLVPAELADARFGEPTVRDILAELQKPGRDPRGDFRVAQHTQGVATLADLQVGMVLEGTVTNVAAFGAFVDVGVHQDGLVHVSALSRRFVKDAHEAVKAGDIVRVKVLEVDAARKRIALSMRLDDTAPQSGGGTAGRAARPTRAARTPRAPTAPQSTAMAQAFARLQPSKSHV